MTAEISIRLPSVLAERLRTCATETGFRRSDAVRAAVAEFFKNHPTPGEQIAAVSRFRVAAAK